MANYLRWLGSITIFIGTASAAPAVERNTQIGQSTFAAKPIVQLSQSNSPSNENSFELEDFEFWVEQCNILSQERQYAEALKACEQAILLKPRRPNEMLWFVRGTALFYLGRYAESLVSFNRIVTSDSSFSAAMAYQCANFYQLQRYQEAIDSCNQALQIDGNWGTSSPAFAWYYSGLASKQTGRLETALNAFERALQIDPANLQAQAERCGILALLQRTPNTPPNCSSQGAVVAYEQSLAVNPDNTTLWIQQGEALEQFGNTGSGERALTAYNRAIELNPKSSEALARRCGILNGLEDYEAALASCAQAFQGDNRWGARGISYAWSQNSVALAGLGRYEEALAAADRAIAANPNDASGWASRAISMWRLNQNELAQYQPDQKVYWIGCLDPRVFNLDPAILNAVNTKLCIKQDIEIAIRLYAFQIDQLPQETFDRSTPDSPILLHREHILALFNKGRILSSLREYQDAVIAYEQAIQAYEQAIQVNGNQNQNMIRPISSRMLATIFTNLSAAYLHFDLEQARSASQRAVAFDRESFAAWYNRGLACTELGDYGCAHEAYEQADRLSPNNLYVMTGQGILLEKTGQIQEAIALFNQILNLDPNQSIAQHHYNSLMQQLRQNPSH